MENNLWLTNGFSFHLGSQSTILFSAPFQLCLIGLRVGIITARTVLVGVRQNIAIKEIVYHQWSFTAKPQRICSTFTVSVSVVMFSMRLQILCCSGNFNNAYCICLTRDDLLRALPKLQEEVSKWCAAADKHSNAVGNQQNMKEVKQLVKEALNDTDHSLFSLHERWGSLVYVPIDYSAAVIKVEISNVYACSERESLKSPVYYVIILGLMCYLHVPLICTAVSTVDKQTCSFCSVE